MAASRTLTWETMNGTFDHVSPSQMDAHSIFARYLDIQLTRESNITTGKIYNQVIERERRGDYLGKTVQVVPHITDAIQHWIEQAARIPVDDSGEEPDICISILSLNIRKCLVAN